MKVAKRFRWEAVHRLSWHEGQCRHFHGHSYRVVVELDGELAENDMLLDFKLVKRILTPLVEKWNYAVDEAPLIEKHREEGSYDDWYEDHVENSTYQAPDRFSTGKGGMTEMH